MALRQARHDGVERTRAVAQGEDLAGGCGEEEAALGVEEHVAAGERVVAQARAPGESGASGDVHGASRGGPTAACTQSSRCQRISVLRTRAATQAACSSCVRASRVTNAS